MDYNKLFKDEAFNNIDKDFLDNIEKLAKDIKGKNINESMLQIISFYNSIPKDMNITKEKREAIIEVIFSNLEEKDRKNFFNMLELINSLTNS